jgi:hypothetical protein
MATEPGRQPGDDAVVLERELDEALELISYVARAWPALLSARRPALAAVLQALRESGGADGG